MNRLLQGSRFLITIRDPTLKWESEVAKLLKTMANENGDDITPTNDVNEDVIVEENDDVDALKEKFEKISEQNKQLFARAKKAEGFELKDGEWVKPPKVEKPKEVKPKVENEPDKEPSKSDELGYGEKAFLKTYSIQGSDELALVKSFQSRTGDDLDTIVSDDIFLGKLQSLRDARESANAVPKGKSRSGQTGVTDVDLAVAKFKEDGTFPEDFETRNKVVDAVTKEEKGALFNNFK